MHERQNGKLDFSEKDRKRIWKNHIEEIVNEENDWNYMTEANMVDGPIEMVTPEEMKVIAMKPIKIKR